MEDQVIIDQPENTSTKKTRPTAITIICVIGFIGAVFTIPLLFTDIAQQIGNWYPPYLALSAMVGLICMIGLWKMKSWAAYVYTGFVALNQVVLFSMGVWNVMALIIPGIVVAIALSHVKNMD